MRHKLLLLTILFYFSLYTSAQVFQEHFQIAGRHFHEVFTEQLGGSSGDLVISGNFFDDTLANPLLEVLRIDKANGDLDWHFMFYDASGTMTSVRGFDMCTYSGAAGDIIALTGYAQIADSSHVCVIRVDEFGNYLDGAFYRGIVPAGKHSQGLNIIRSQQGFVIGGFACMDYDQTTQDDHTGFVLRIDDALVPQWSKNIFTTYPSTNEDYDMVSEVIATDDGYFISGSVTCMPVFTQQAVLSMKLDFNGNMVWASSYEYGNSRDVGVDAYYEAGADRIYLLANYSASHYFGVTVFDDDTGTPDLSRSWRAYDWNNLDRYGFRLMESQDTSNLVVAGYMRNGTYQDEYGNTIMTETVPFAYEFEKASGDQAGMAYYYHIPYSDPGFNDFFDFWTYQMPLIYYPEMALKLKDTSEYFLAGLRTDSLTAFTEAELMKTDLAHENACYRSVITLQHDPVQPNIVPTDTANSNALKYSLVLTPVPFDHIMDSSCRVLPAPVCSCDSLAKDVDEGFAYNVSGFQLDVKPVALDLDCDSVEWDWGDGNTSNSQGNQSVSYTYSSGGVYHVCMSVTRFADDGSICRDSTCMEIPVDIGTGLHEEDDHHLVVYPNPAKNTLTIEVGLTGKAVPYKIYNATGMQVTEGRLEDERTLLDISSFPQGIYILKINTDTGQFVRKVFVE
jgi:hypothetical protein